MNDNTKLTGTLHYDDTTKEEVKIADNKININKASINRIDNEIDSNKNKIKTLTDMEDGFVSLSKNIEKCVELLSMSMKGNHIENKLSDISESNQVYLKKVVSTIDDEKTTATARIKNLYDEKDRIEKEQKALYRELEEKDHIHDKEEEKEAPEVKRNEEIEVVTL